MAAGKGGAESVVDDSLVEDDDLEGDDLGGEGGEPKGEKDEEKTPIADDLPDELEVDLGEEATEDDVRERQRKAEEAGALERDDDQDRDAGGEDKTEYGKKVQARIERERRIARDATARADNERAARVKAERQAIDMQKEAVETTKTALAMQIDGVKADLKKAIDDGKTDKQVELQGKLNSLQNRLGSVEEAEKGLLRHEAELKQGASEVRNPRADQWMRDNPWFTNTKFAEATALVKVIDRAMAVGGWDKNSPEYFEELDRRIRRRIPEVVKYSKSQPTGNERDRGARREPGQRPKEVTAGTRRDAGAGGQQVQRTRGKVTLGKADFENMRNFGLDPKNAEHQKEWAKNKVRG